MSAPPRGELAPEASEGERRPELVVPLKPRPLGCGIRVFLHYRHLLLRNDQLGVNEQWVS